MKRKIALLGYLCLVTLVTAQPRFNGFVQNWTAYNLNDDHDLFLLRNRFQLNSTLSGDWARGFASVDFTDERQLDLPIQEVGIRELYVDLYFDKFDLRVGKQQVVWGKADGVFINDIVNNLDLRYFLMQDFKDIRQGTGMVKANAYVAGWGLEALFIPKFEPNEYAEPGSPWEFFRPSGMIAPLMLNDTSSYNLPVAFTWQGQELPDATLANSEFGLKLSGFALGTDLSFLFLHSYQDSYVSRIDSIAFTPDPLSSLAIPQSGHLYMTPVFKPVNMYGINFARPVGGLVVRGEVGYFNDYHFISRPDLSQDMIQTIMAGGQPEVENVVVSDYLQGVVGLDISGPWGSSISTQYIRKQVLDYQSAIMSSDEVAEMLSLMMSGTFWNETASAQWLTLYDSNYESGLSRLIFGYEVADAVQLDLGVDILWGEAGSFIGQFAANDNGYLKLTYSF